MLLLLKLIRLACLDFSTTIALSRAGGIRTHDLVHPKHASTAKLDHSLKSATVELNHAVPAYKTGAFTNWLVAGDG